MAMSGTVALSSSSSAAATLAGRPRLQSTGVLARSCWNGGDLAMETNLQENAVRLVTLRHTRSSSGRNAVDKISQACQAAARKMVYNSHKEITRIPELTNDEHHHQKMSWSVNFQNPPIDHQSARREDVAQNEATQQLGPHPYKGVYIGDSWREIQGERNWEGRMLHPLDYRLRSELIRYGEFAQATYDAFDTDDYSKYCGSCKFTKDDFFSSIGLDNREYDMFEYLYSTCNIRLPKSFKTSKVPDYQKWSKCSNWAGFVAVCSDAEAHRLGRRDIVISWRGTSTEFEWLEDVEMTQRPAGEPPGVVKKSSSLNKANVSPPGAVKKSSTSESNEVKVESGFLSIYTSRNKDSTHNKASARDQVMSAVQRLMEKYKDQEISITVTGHSLGGALAILSAYDIAQWLSDVDDDLEDNHAGEESNGRGASTPNSVGGRVPMITAFTFASPRVGNKAFKSRLEKLGVKVMRVVNVHDFVPHVPALILHTNLSFMRMIIPWMKNFLPMRVIQLVREIFTASYTHVGVELKVNNLKSPFIKWTLLPGSTHNLEVYLHLLTGVKGRRSLEFSEALFTKQLRDPALVNKSASLLKDRFEIPDCWFQELNKGLVKIRGCYKYELIQHEDFPEQAYQQEPFFEEELAEESTRHPVDAVKTIPNGDFNSIGIAPSSGS